MNVHPPAARPSAPLAAQLAAALGMILVLVAGIFVWGRIANDDRVAMLLTALWFALVLVAAIVLTRTNTSLRLPLAAGYILVAAVAAVLLGLPMLGDDEVNEQVVTAAPAAKSSAARAAGADGARERRGGTARTRREAAARAPRANVQVARGAFRSIVHPGTGNAAVIELARGGRKLTLTQFETDNGPDLRVYLATGDPHGGGELGDFEDLGALKGNKGNQQYDIPKDVNVFKYATVVVWCRAFSVPFTSARLARS